MAKKYPSVSKPKGKLKVKRKDLPSLKNDVFPIVGIGASAGGLDAYKQLLQHIPSDIGMGFVLIQHLAPRYESALTELLSRSINIPITEVKDGMVVEPNKAYVISPNTDLAILNGALCLTPRSTVVGHHMPIDHFLRSLAADRGTKAIGVILSGTGSDGTLGMNAIKAEGGITFAQDEDSATHPEMPRSAVSAGSVDFVLSPEGIARELKRLGGHPYIRQPKPPDAAETFLETEPELDNIFTLLRKFSGVNFFLYKQTTIKRRMWRRMALHKIDTPRAYLKFIKDNPAELQALYEDILIQVTGFFRDPTGFEALKAHVFPALAAGRDNRSPVRIWVPGCSTGEEVYSIIIAFLEFLGPSAPQIPLQMFATDINESAVQRARAGAYLQNINADVSTERLRRFFIKTEHGYQISKTIRDMCVFARHDVTRDPPFSKLDLISCRNLLIYLGPVLQKKIVPFFVYALRPEGFLWLGTSEHLAGSEEYFTLVDKTNKIYSRKLAISRPVFDLSSTGFLTGKESGGKRPGDSPTGYDVQKEADRLLLTKYTPPGVIVNTDLEIVQFRGRTGLFLEPAPGQASLTLPRMAREGLLADLRSAIHKAQKEGDVVRKEGVQVKSNGRTLNVTIEVVPLTGPSSRDRHFLVLFNETLPPQPPERRSPRTAREKKQEALQAREVPRLKEELTQTRNALQSIIEQQETTNEELRSANEEILSANEELQSTNEELETAKEELQSANEELTTVNEELQNRNSQLTVANEDLNNLFSTVNLPIVMVGGDLRIRRFTPIAEKILNIIPGDIGRPIGNIRPNVEISDLGGLIRETIDTITVQEREVQDSDGHWYSLRIRPYRTSDNRIEGAVLMLLDIDSLKAEVHESRVYAASIVETVQHPLVVLDEDLKVRSANQAFYEQFHVSREETEKRSFYTLGNGQWNIPKLRELLDAVIPGKTTLVNFEVEHDFPVIGRKTMLLNARTIRQKHASSRLILLAIEDITDRALAVESLRKSEELFETLFESSPDALVASGSDGRIARVNRRTETMFGYGRDELAGKPIEILIPERFKDRHTGHREDYYADPKVRPMGAGLELHGRRKDGSEFPVDIMLSPLERGEVKLILAVIRDITERKKAEKALRDSETRTRTIIESAHDAFVAISTDGTIADWNLRAKNIFGWPREEVIGKRVISTIVPPHRRDVFERRLSQYLRTGKSPYMNRSVETRALHREGHEIPVEISITPLKLDGSLFFAAFIRDISERKRSAEALHDREAQLDSILKASPSIIFVKDNKGRYLVTNPQFQQLTSLRADQIVGKTDSDLFPPGQAEAFRANDAKVHRTGKPVSFEEFAVHEDGVHTSVVTKFPLRNPRGEIYGIGGIVTDITERKRAEDALRLLVEVTAAAAEADDARSMTARCLELFCRLGNWHLAQAWYRDSRQNLFLCDERVFYSQIDAPLFRKASLETTFTPGQGVIGQTWSDMKPVWVEDIAALRGQTSFLRQNAAQESGLQSMFALPISAEQRVFAIWEFLSSAKRRKDPHFVEVAQRLGNHLAVVFERKLAKKTLGDLSMRLMKSQDDERRKIARDLHDSTAQALAAAGMNLAALDGEARALNPRASRLLAESARLVDEASNELRTIAHLLHPPILDQGGLPSALRWYVGAFSERSGIQVELAIPQDFGRIPQDSETALFRIVQEGLNNVQRHAQTNWAQIRIVKDSDEVTLELTDRGIGLPENAREPSAAEPGPRGLGLVGMRERARELGGRFEMNSSTHGTTIKAVLPLGPR